MGDALSNKQIKPGGEPAARSRGGELALANSWPLAGFGTTWRSQRQESRGLSLDLSLKAARQKKRNGTPRQTAPKRQREAPGAPPNSPNSANPLTWETSRFPSHGELRTGFPKRGGPKLLQQLPLTVEKLLTVRPLPLPLAPVF